MTDRESLKTLYEDMYAAMTAKDEKKLDRIHDESFVLIHMTGMCQDKRSYIRAILDGTLNYYSATTEALETAINGDSAIMTGRSVVSAAVFGGGIHSWRLQLKFHAKKDDGTWKLTQAEASTY